MKNWEIYFCMLAVMLSACGSMKKAATFNAPYIEANHQKTHHDSWNRAMGLSNLRGKIRSLTEYGYSTDEDLKKRRPAPGVLSGTFIFDKDKRIVERWKYLDSPEGRFIQTKSYYSSYKDYVCDSVIYYNAEGEVRQRQLYFYADRGLLIEERRIVQGQADSRKYPITKVGDTLIHGRYEYVDKHLFGNMIERKSSDGRYLYKLTYRPNNSLKSKQRFEEGLEKLHEEFDKQGNLIYQHFMDHKNGVLVLSVERRMVFDRNGQKQKETELMKSEGSPPEPIKVSSYEDGRLVLVTQGEHTLETYQYDSYGNLMAEIKRGDSFSYEYDYDKKGNWTKRIKYKEGSPITITERSIEYY